MIPAMGAGGKLLRAQGRALTLVMASSIALGIAGSAPPAALVGIIVLAMLMATALYRTRSPHRRVVLETAGVICSCAAAMELVFLTLNYLSA